MNVAAATDGSASAAPVAIEPPLPTPAPTLKPAPAGINARGLEPIRMNFKLTDNFHALLHLGNRFLSGVSFELIGGQTNIDELAPSATFEGVAQDNAPQLGQGVRMGHLSLQARFDDMNPDSGVQCSTPADASVGTNVDIQGAYYVELDRFHADETRANGSCCSAETDYVVASAHEEPSGASPSVTSDPITVTPGGSYTARPDGPLVLGPTSSTL